MPRRSLTTLVNNPNLIPGIYNYCDRWCERCPLTSRCLVYASEQDDKQSGESQDISNEQFWRKLNSIMDETREMIAEWANQAGIDLTQSEDEHQTRTQRRRQLVDNHPLAKAGKKYATAASDWFREFEQTINSENSGPLDDAREVIQWYQYQISIKTIRALSSREEEPAGPAELPKDSDGSAKVALLGIDRSAIVAGAYRIDCPLDSTARTFAQSPGNTFSRSAKFYPARLRRHFRTRELAAEQTPIETANSTQTLWRCPPI